ncbi:cyclase family protein [Candidatus Nitrosotenuis chungbukensis]|uniref:cyclase family protein n=1 Tax=Candidatus Nitrosotenuis chungbukensis TaxID=1353246 RepID=UPI0005B26940|nr:cyclase family protein [Candidatus Nitrosotenuis chungbukensis]
MKPIDLTLTISQDIPSFPGSPRPHFMPWAEIKKEKYNLEMLFLSTHTGTHVDAPYHFIKNGRKIHQISPERFVCNAILIRVKGTPNYKITKRDIIEFESKHGSIPAKSAAIFHTGWNDNLERKDFFEKNPGITESAARYLSLKKISLVGIDSPSIDIGSNASFSAHKILLKSDVLILENLCNLDRIKKTHFGIIALPLKLQGATGSPVRAVAF